jgi:ubiquinone/menaquinone biosynthesis C-methylase UbiE
MTLASPVQTIPEHVVDPAAAFGGLASVYEVGRPLYPINSIRYVAPHFEQGGVLLDMGAGNGRTLRSVFRHVAPDNFKYIQAVEPARKMHTPMRQNLWNVPALHVQTGNFHNIPASDQSVDTIICGASIHWGTATQNDADKTRAEMLRVLKPSGKLILLSDQWDHTEGISAELYDLQERCFALFQERQGQSNPTPWQPDKKPSLRSLYKRCQNLVSSEEHRQFEQKKEGIHNFLDHNGLNGFFEDVWGGVHTEVIVLEPSQIHKEFASQIYVSNLTDNEQAELHDYLDVRLAKNTDNEGFIPCKRTCFSIAGTLAR